MSHRHHDPHLEHMRRMMGGGRDVHHEHTREVVRTDIDKTAVDDLEARQNKRLADIEQALELIIGRLDSASSKNDTTSPKIMGLIDDLGRRLRSVEIANQQAPSADDARLIDCERRVSAMDAHIQAMDQAIRRVIGDDAQRARAIAAVQQGTDVVRADVHDLMSKVAAIELSVGPSPVAADDFDLPRVLGGGQKSVPQSPPPLSGSVSARIASVEDAIDDIGKRIDTTVKRLGGVDQQLAAIADKMREPEPEVKPEVTVQDARLDAIAAIKAAGVSRRKAPIQVADASVVEGRLFEVAINAKSFGRPDAVDALGALVGADGAISDIASDIIASHDMLLLLTARTVALERQATSAITRPELATIAAVEAERDVWIGRINAATGIGDGKVDGN